MHRLNVEWHTPSNQKSLAQDIAFHLYANMLYGKAVVVTDKPLMTLSAVRKEWRGLIHEVQDKCAGTTDITLACELAGQVDYMQDVRFTAIPPDDLLEANVTFATVEDFVRTPPVCYAMYVAYPFEKEKLHMITSWMPDRGVVIIYGRRSDWAGGSSS